MKAFIEDELKTKHKQQINDLIMEKRELERTISKLEKDLEEAFEMINS